MKTHSHIFGYLLGLVIFVIGIPALMVLVAENDWIHIQRDTLKWSLLALLAIAGLALSIWPVVIFIVEVILLTLQVRSEEKRLEADFGEEYLQYKAITKRY